MRLDISVERTRFDHPTQLLAPDRSIRSISPILLDLFRVFSISTSIAFAMTEDSQDFSREEMIRMAYALGMYFTFIDILHTSQHFDSIRLRFYRPSTRSTFNSIRIRSTFDFSTQFTFDLPSTRT